jgi:ADP-ribose pyrophosphatase
VKNKSLKETKVNGKTLYKGNFLEVRVDQVRLPDKTTSKRFYILHPGAAVIIAEVKKDHYLFIEQYRYAIGETMLELPAGKRDHKENTLVTAKRELLEETGYAAKKMKKLGSLHPCIGYSNELIDVFYTKEMSFQKQNLDHGEFLNVLILSRKQIEKAIKNGKITDAKTLSAWLIYKNAL